MRSQENPSSLPFEDKCIEAINGFETSYPHQANYVKWKINGEKIRLTNKKGEIMGTMEYFIRDSGETIFVERTYVSDGTLPPIQGFSKEDMRRKGCAIAILAHVLLRYTSIRRIEADMGFTNKALLGTNTQGNDLGILRQTASYKTNAFFGFTVIDPKRSSLNPPRLSTTLP